MRVLAWIAVWLPLLTWWSPTLRADTLASAQRVLGGLPVEGDFVDLAAHLETEGHWTFANRNGERFTASGPAELKRAFATLAPGATDGEQLRFVVTLSTLFAAQKSIAALPGSALFAAIDDAPYGVIRGDGAPRVRVSAAVSVAAANERDLAEALWHLARPIERSHVRVLGFDVTAPGLLASSPRLDAATGKVLVDRIDPTRAVAAVGSARAQTLLITGRAAGANILVDAGGSGDSVLKLGELVAAAASADVALIVLQTDSSAQPGGRNWLWLPVDVPGLEGGSAPKLVDLIGLAAGGQAMTVRPTQDRDGRTALLASRETAGGFFTASRWTRMMADAAAGMLGKSPATTVAVHVPSSARQRELDRRFVKAVPSYVQFGYLGLCALGLLGAPMAWRWFARIWPAEAARDYAGLAGYLAAWVVRAALFAIVFMPLAAIVAAPAQLIRLLRRKP